MALIVKSLRRASSSREAKRTLEGWRPEIEAAALHDQDPEAASDGDRPLEQCLDLRWSSRSHDVVIGRLDAKQTVAHAAAGEQRLVSCIAQAPDHARRFVAQHREDSPMARRPRSTNRATDRPTRLFSLCQCVGRGTIDGHG
jgi:hypothetical protein